MFFAMELPSIEWGISSDEYWSMTFNEIMTQNQANKTKHERELREKAMFDYKQSQLMMYAFNDPSKMPDLEKMYPFLSDEKEIEQAEKIKPKEIQAYDADADAAIFLAAAQGARRYNEQNK